MAALSAAVEFGRVTAGQPSRSQPTRPTRARIIRPTRRCDLPRSSPLLMGSPEHAREVPRVQQRAVGTRSAAADGEFECWSNANGAVLSGPFRQDLYAAERAFLWNSIDVGGRSAVVRLSDGSLWVHSPVRLDGRYKDALATLGPVKSIIVSIPPPLAVVTIMSTPAPFLIKRVWSKMRIGSLGQPDFLIAWAHVVLAEPQL